MQSGNAAHLQQQGICSTLPLFISHIYNSASRTRPPLRSLPTSFFSSSFSSFSSSSSTVPTTPPSTRLSPSRPHSVAHLAIASPPPHRNQFRPAAPHRHGMLAKGDGALSGSPLQPPAPHLSALRPPSISPRFWLLPPRFASQHFLNMPGVSAGRRDATIELRCRQSAGVFLHIM